MYDELRRRLARLADAGCGPLLGAGRKGVEKECLRATADGGIAPTPHPAALGSALTHPSLTTDYSEALLEFVTPPFPDRAGVVACLGDLHRFVYRHIGDELLWAASMPCRIAGDESIPVARFGTSNSGRLRHLYRVGLGHRYGRTMQVIAGVHFNYSLDPGVWPLLSAAGAAHGPQRVWRGTGRALADSHYFGLIRNLFRHGWLLLYLFGASPAAARSFLPDGAPGLEPLDADTWYAPFATSLRMSGIGYTNRIQGGIDIRYDDLYGYTAGLRRAVTTAHPPWQALGVRKGGEYVQLNANLLQMENEYYSSVRPKQLTRRGERPAAALERRGVRYVELRSIDLDPASAVGLTEERLLFLEVFMLFCLLHDSPPLGGDERRAADENQNRAAVRGRDPALVLERGGGGVDGGRAVSLRAWANELLDEMAGVAELLDGGSGGAAGAVVEAARGPVEEPDAAPSARVLQEMRGAGLSFLEHTLERSRRHAGTLRAEALPEERLRALERQAAESLAAQAALETGDAVSFEEYLEDYLA